MGLKEKSGVVSILLGVLVAAIAIAQLTYVIISGNESIRIFLVGSAMGMFAVLGLAILRVVENDSDVDEAHKERASTLARDCPDFWRRSWDCNTSSYTCSPTYDLPDGSSMRMREGSDINLATFNGETPENRCTEVRKGDASFSYTEMINRCNAWSRS